MGEAWHKPHKSWRGCLQCGAKLQLLLEVSAYPGSMTQSYSTWSSSTYNNRGIATSLTHLSPPPPPSILYSLSYTGQCYLAATAAGLGLKQRHGGLQQSQPAAIDSSLYFNPALQLQLRNVASSPTPWPVSPAPLCKVPVAPTVLSFTGSATPQLIFTILLLTRHALTVLYARLVLAVRGLLPIVTHPILMILQKSTSGLARMDVLFVERQKRHFCPSITGDEKYHCT